LPRGGQEAISTAWDSSSTTKNAHMVAMRSSPRPDYLPGEHINLDDCGRRRRMRTSPRGGHETEQHGGTPRSGAWGAARHGRRDRVRWALGTPWRAPQSRPASARRAREAGHGGAARARRSGRRREHDRRPAARDSRERGAARARPESAPRARLGLGSAGLRQGAGRGPPAARARWRERGGRHVAAALRRRDLHRGRQDPPRRGADARLPRAAADQRAGSRHGSHGSHRAERRHRDERPRGRGFRGARR
jgi:hypothetical protein